MVLLAPPIAPPCAPAAPATTAQKRAAAQKASIPPGLPAGYVAPATVPDLLHAAAGLVLTNGHHRGEYWTEARFGVPLYREPVKGHAALYLAAGFNPYMRWKPFLIPPCVVTQAEEWLAAYLVVRGEEPRYDTDRYLDLDLMIEVYEQDQHMTGAELADMLRDCAEYVRTGGGR